MQVLLDGKSVVTPRASVAAAIAAGADAARRDGRIVIEVKVDGELLHGEALDTASDVEGAAREVRLISADPRTVVRQTVLDGVEALDALRGEQGRAAEQLQTGDTADALNSLQGVFMTWQAVRDVTSRGAQVLNIDLDMAQFPGIDADVNFKTATQSLLGHLGQVRTALAAQDWSAISDIVGYDLDADAVAWRALLNAFAAHIDSPGARAS